MPLAVVDEALLKTRIGHFQAWAVDVCRRGLRWLEVLGVVAGRLSLGGQGSARAFSTGNISAAGGEC